MGLEPLSLNDQINMTITGPYLTTAALEHPMRQYPLSLFGRPI
jgi:hypothetical protein